ncbi:thrombomodulin-like [Sander lucioperca]|uniref:thrombomodulin-like n=1 Tax=Sander lucioperca TaxID=283035 RepID=UPI00125E512C|nr:thrombomodulin-like [Sander lucioperca]
MIPTTHALLIWVLFLCAQEETVQSQRGHCTGNQCFALFQELGDFAEAQKRCKDSGGHSLMVNSEHVEKLLKSPLSGSYWLKHDKNAAAGSQSCPCISVSEGRNITMLSKPCRDTLDGFLCLYTFDEPCSGLQAAGDATVKYTYAPMDFEMELDDKETFPPGTIAIAKKLDGKYFDSKHLCFSSRWLKAPWNCEVLQGGCEYNCSSTTGGCVCPAGEILHPNNIACTDSCQSNPCTGEGEECETTQTGFTCTCKDGFEKEDGKCVDVTICEKCEHDKCDKSNGSYKCACRKGFRVSPHDPTKCEMICTERDCPSICVPDNANELKCFCIHGYIQDVNPNDTLFCTDIDECESGGHDCAHQCENLLGSYRCLCNEGFKLLPNNYECVQEQEEDDDGSGSTAPYPSPASPRPATVVPFYIKTGSAMGITVFIALCAVLLYFLIRNVVKRCGKFELSSFKHPDIDIFYLQQVTTETYKRMSFDKQFKNDSPTIL